MIKILKTLSSQKLGRILFISVFLWTLLAGLVIQKVVLVYIFPNLNAGYGLLSGTDYINFHHIAADLAEEIHNQGWSVWKLLPQGQAVSGIAAIFYALFTPQPWVLLPWNSFLHALGVFYLFQTMLLILKKKELAMLAVIPCAFFPSAFTWTTMMHNENYAVLGAMLVLYSLVRFFHDSGRMNIKGFIYIFILNLIGHGMILMVRPAASQALAAISLMCMLGYGCFAIVRVLVAKKEVQPSKRVLLIGLASTMLITFLQITIATSFSIFVPVTTTQPTLQPTTQPKPEMVSWQRSNWLPGFIDSKLSQMISMRRSQLSAHPDGATNVDVLVSFNNALDVIKYLPRALEIGFLSPFFSQWFERGYKESSQMQRLMSGVEMLFSYFALLGLPVIFWRNWKIYSFWFLALTCIGMLIVYSISMPNIGTIVRFRYPFFTPMIGLGLVGSFHMLNKKIIKYR